MTDYELKIRTQELLHQGKIEEALQFIFDSYKEAHPEAKNVSLYRDKVCYKIRNEFSGKSEEEKRNAKLLVYALMTVFGHSEGETAFNLVLLLMHLLHRSQAGPVSEAMELIKLERASNNLNMAS
ncbi:hypothetical protein [Adhaeribacter soli]|uniref:Uncharacterized protein n=1 Tax=Adhaeribacter soli TaxID=2607655 RepID=A0A5N1IU59_9BACT|nr:hypothetical protein [Adhaeribacter soli]KAA9333550.1 hypothetical protein F0P94_09840 [Adhaeribacter soli]